MVGGHVCFEATVLSEPRRTEMTTELRGFLTLVFKMSLKVFLVFVLFPALFTHNHPLVHYVT